ncbi:aminotransferase class V-fold PLP-dependent enzyme [Candidatus Fermentibacteria bacterium]|nr:aminotransferase class V-fold PLP-dependent enzyme [Candidatus Fermentibacteria bacterium]
MRAVNLRGPLARCWDLDEDVVYLNHGSFGACPREVRDHRRMLLDRLERDPMDFMLQLYPVQIRKTIHRLETFLGAQPQSVVLVGNATKGVSTVLQCLSFESGDELLTTGQEYFASYNALCRKAKRTGARVVQAELPFPLREPERLLEAVLREVTPRTRLLLVDHILSPTGVVMPLQELVEELSASPVQILVDGAHGPGSVPINLESLGVHYYTGNCHKWLCSPKTCAVLYVRPDLQDRIGPLAQSYTEEDMDIGSGRFQLEFIWNGTFDPTPRLAVSRALEYMASLIDEGWKGIMRENHRKAMQAREEICSVLDLDLPCPDRLCASMAALPLPWMEPPSPFPVGWTDPLQKTLREEHGIVVPVTWVRKPRRRLLRISAQLYNGKDEYRYLADTLRRTGLRGG